MLCKHLGLVNYQPTFDAMKAFTRSRTHDTEDEIWLLQHPPVYTQGLSGKAEHILNPGSVPVIQIDRGGQVTYHGPGQWVAYVLYDLRRNRVNIRELVSILEIAVIDLLAELGVSSEGNSDARGVYVDGRKVASLGLKVSRGCSYHGLALNSHMDLSPFEGINPCGYSGLEVTSLLSLLGDQCPSMDSLGQLLLRNLKRSLPTPH